MLRSNELARHPPNAISKRLGGLPPMRYAVLVGKGLQQPSGRVIALGRLMLATLFMLAIWVDASQPALAPDATYALLIAYILVAAAIVGLTWKNWWLDARLAGPAHAADILLFMALVLLTEGYTSPFFTFFIFVLLSAAIRWGWRATALTALLLTLLYVLAGLLVVGSNVGFDLQRFVVRTGHLVIVSLILVWFGVNQWQARFLSREADLITSPSFDESPLESALRVAMGGVGAATGTFVWRERSGASDGVAIREGVLGPVDATGAQLSDAEATPFLYDIARRRALRRDVARNLAAFAPESVITPGTATALGLSEGLAIPIRSEAGTGRLYLEEVRNLSTDHLDLGEQVAADVATHMQRLALLKAAEESAEARSRLTLARDLHDSVVQFLAGAAFRLEAIKRSETSGRAIGPELNELKQLMMEEQGELRSFISALRSGPLVAFTTLARDLEALAARLTRQWGIECELSSRAVEMMIPTRLHLDALQLMREAVANAVRHAGAKSVRVKLSASAGQLKLEIVNDGTILPRRGAPLEKPQSLTERVEQVGGTLELARGMGVVKLSIMLPTDRRHS